MNDEDKVSVNSNRLTELVKLVGSHRKLEGIIATLFKEKKVSTTVSDSMIYRMMNNHGSKFKVKDLRAVAVALKVDIEAIAEMNQPGFKSIECIQQESGQSLYSAINDCDLIDVQLLVEPADAETQANLVEFVELIECIYDERGTNVSSIKDQLQDKLEIKRRIDLLSSEVSVLVGRAKQLLPFDQIKAGVNHRHYNSPYDEHITVHRRQFDSVNPRVWDEREEAWIYNGGGIDFAKVLLIRFGDPQTHTKTEQVEVDPGELAFFGPFDQSNFVEAENVVRSQRGSNQEVSSLAELEKLPLQKICSGYVRAMEKRRREEIEKPL